MHTKMSGHTIPHATPLTLPMDLPLISRIILPNQPHTPNLRRIQHLSAHAQQPLHRPVGPLPPPSLMRTLLIIRPLICAPPTNARRTSLPKPRRVAEVRRGPALYEPRKSLPARGDNVIREGEETGGRTNAEGLSLRWGRCGHRRWPGARMMNPQMLGGGTDNGEGGMMQRSRNGQWHGGPDEGIMKLRLKDKVRCR